MLKKKSQKNASKDQISAKFFSATAEREVISHKIFQNSFVPLTRFNADMSVIDDLNSESALQVFKTVLGEGSTRIHVDFKLDEGRPVIKYVKNYISDGQEIQITLSAQNLIEVLKTIGDHVINTIERNTAFRISQVSLIFIQDIDRKVWLMGSSQCIVYEKPALHRQIAPIKLPYKSNHDLPSNLSRTQSVKRTAPLKKCPGDFCEYTLQKNSKIFEKTDAEYDEFISKITLAFYSDTNVQSCKYKQGLGTNCVEKEHEKLRVFQISNSIPFRYLLLGRSLLSSKGKGKSIEVTAKEIKKLFEPEYNNIGKPPNPLAHPSRIYDEAKVCDNCYQVYNLIRMLKGKQKTIKYLPMISRDIPEYFAIDNTALKEAVSAQDLTLLNPGSKTQFSMLYSITVNEKNQNAEVHEKIIEDIAEKVFPNDFANSWGIRTQHQKNSESWKKYINGLKAKSVLRNRLKP